MRKQDVGDRGEVSYKTPVVPPPKWQEKKEDFPPYRQSIALVTDNDMEQRSRATSTGAKSMNLVVDLSLGNEAFDAGALRCAITFLFRKLVSLSTITENAYGNKSMSFG
ncbi:unnamed protein product [Soboliphyme baturini]|uniref:Uncharacterized protein n=1 Tax=Soboliphyme baturini TaxID=241478 RepID=A0A183ILK6_9BILA|nr:unnamed protein product [Soboliphyme baturini]